MSLHEKIVNGWEISADGYSKIVQDDFVSPGREIWTDLILEKSPHDGVLDILDVGTGPGVFATILTLAGHRVTGIDLSPKMLENARANAAAHGASPTFVLMDSQQITFPENSFDLIVSRNVMWIMEEPEKVYETWKKILKPGGRILVFDGGHNRENFLTKFDHNNHEYVEEFEKKFGKEVRMSFKPEQYEEARGWKKELKLSYVERPEWDVEVLQTLGYSNIGWDDVAERSAYTEELRFEYSDKIFFRLYADK